MKLRILPSALNDLAASAEFYERQGKGLGSYFLDTLFSDIDSLLLYAGIHRRISTYHRALSRRFPYAIYFHMPSITAFTATSSKFGACWIAGETPRSFAKH